MAFNNAPTPAVFPWMPERGKVSMIATPIMTAGTKRNPSKKWWKRNPKMIRQSIFLLDPLRRPNFEEVHAFQWIGMKPNENLPIGMRNYFARPRVQTPGDRPKQIRSFGIWGGFGKDFSEVKPETPLSPRLLEREANWDVRHHAVVKNEGFHQFERSYFGRIRDFDHGFDPDEPVSTLLQDEMRYDLDQALLALENRADNRLNRGTGNSRSMNQLALADQEHQNNSATVDDSAKEAVEKILLVNNAENNEMNKSSSSSLAKNIKTLQQEKEELDRQESEARQERLKKDFKMPVKERRKLEAMEKDYQKQLLKTNLAKIKVGFEKEKRNWKPPKGGLDLHLELLEKHGGAMLGGTRYGGRGGKGSNLHFMLDDPLGDTTSLDMGANAKRAMLAKNNGLSTTKRRSGSLSGTRNKRAILSPRSANGAPQLQNVPAVARLSYQRQPSSPRTIQRLEDRPGWDNNFQVLLDNEKAAAGNRNYFDRKVEKKSNYVESRNFARISDRPVVTGVLGVSVDLDI